MIFYVIVFFISIVIVEFLFFVNFKKIINSSFETFKKIQKVILSKNNSDHWKEKVLLEYSKRLLKNSIILISIIFAFIIFLFVINFFNKEIIIFLFTIKGSVLISCEILIYYYLRKKLITNY